MGSTSRQTPPTAETLKQSAGHEKSSEAEEKTYSSLSAELVYYVLTAELAWQRGELGIAADFYQHAAELTASPLLARRSAQMAGYSRDRQRINRALQRWQQVEPDEADVYIMRIPFLLANGDDEAVVNAVNKAVELSPQKAPDYLGKLSASLTEMASAERAMQIFEQLHCVQRGETYANHAYIRTAGYFKLYDKALAITEKLLQQSNGNTDDYLILKAELLNSMQRTDEALAAISPAAQQASASTKLRFAYAKLLAGQNKTAQARLVFESLHQADPQNKDVLFALGLIALDEKNPASAKAYFSQLLKLGDSSHQAEYFMGLAEQRAGNIESALIWFASVPAQSSRFGLAQTHYVDLLISKGQMDKARQHLAQLREANPQRAVQLYLYEAGVLRDQGMQQSAFDLLTQALQNYPDQPDLRYSRAMVSETLDKLDVLEADLRHILKQDPDNSHALNALGYTLTDRTDRHQEALQLIQKALKIKPEDPFYLDSLGWVYYRMGDLDKAVFYLQKAVALQPDVEFITHLGEVLWEKGDKQQAQQVWDKALKLDAHNALLLETLRRYGQ